MTADIILKAKIHCSIIKDTKNWWAQAEGIECPAVVFAEFSRMKTRYSRLLPPSVEVCEVKYHRCERWRLV